MWLTLQKAAHHIRQGGVVAFPAETAYLLGCDPTNQNAMARMLSLGQRSREERLVLLAADTSQLADWVSASTKEWQQMNANWPGLVIFLAAPGNKVIAGPVQDDGRVAIRVTRHLLARFLAEDCHHPIATIGIRKNDDSLHYQAESVDQALGSMLDGIVHGACNDSGQETSVVALREPLK
jgi:L-threonylcarbamoyladenylate synthase